MAQCAFADSGACADSITGELHSLRLAIQDLKATYPDRYPRGGDFMKRLESFEARLPETEKALASTDEPTRKAAEQTVAAIRDLAREALLANPLVSGQPLLFVVRRQYKPDHHNTETMFQTNEINTASFEGGGSMKMLDVAAGAAAGATQTLVDAPDGIVRDPEVHFDGRRIVFSMRKDIHDDYHVYEVNADGTGLRQLTSAKGVTDIDPLYLPDGAIAFSSTREPKYCMCNRHIMANLFRMEADGANIHQIGKSTLFEGHGALLPDGRILYSRWEYIDRNFGDAQGLWTVYPDGAGHAVYWGNNTQSPGAVLNARPIPGTLQIVCVFGSCHDRPWGALAIVDRRLGLDVRPPVVRTWPADAITHVGEGDWNTFNFDTFKDVNLKYEDPYPLSDKYFLCSRIAGKDELMGIYLVDVFGNEVLVHVEEPGCYDPMPLGPRPRPPAIPTRRDFANAEGYFYVDDVYRGTHMKGVERGAVKSLRVVESPEKRFWTQPAWEGQGQEAPAMNWHDFNNKRILGAVPVEADGSAYFAVPSDRYVYFQLLDADGMMIQSMRSGTIIQSGENQGCIGCHEERRSAAGVRAGTKMPLALQRAPSVLNGWHGPARLFSYMAEVQPVLDAHCVRCHDFGTDGGRVLNLARDRDLVFNVSYDELWRKKYIHVVGAGPAQIQQAYSWGSHASKLVDVIRKNHKLPQEDFDRIATWIDINAPYYADYSSAYPANLAGRCPLDNAEIQRLTNLTGVAFANQMAFGKDVGPQVSFDRPESSPCLAKLKDANPAAYQEALAIVQAGRDRLAQHPREDMPGASMCEVDQQHEAKYAMRQQVELRNREAIRKGLRYYDSDNP